MTWTADQHEPFMSGQHHYSIRVEGKPGVRLSIICFPHEVDALIELLNAGSYS
jgi:hypothetical protein